MQLFSTAKIHLLAIASCCASRPLRWCK